MTPALAAAKETSVSLRVAVPSPRGKTGGREEEFPPSRFPSGGGYGYT